MSDTDLDEVEIQDGIDDVCDIVELCGGVAGERLVQLQDLEDGLFDARDARGG